MSGTNIRSGLVRNSAGPAPRNILIFDGLITNLERACAVHRSLNEAEDIKASAGTTITCVSRMCLMSTYKGGGGERRLGVLCVKGES